MKITICTGHLPKYRKKEYDHCKKINKKLFEIYNNNKINQIKLIDIDSYLELPEYSSLFAGYENSMNIYLSHIDVKKKLIKELQSDFAIELHLDEFNGKAHGMGLWTHKTVIDSSAIEFVNEIYKSMKQSLPFKHRGIKESNYNIVKSDIPTAIIEFLFMDNPQDVAYLDYENSYEVLARSIYNGIKRYYFAQLDLLNFI